jgi:hypothetical protein
MCFIIEEDGVVFYNAVSGRAAVDRIHSALLALPSASSLRKR